MNERLNTLRFNYKIWLESEDGENLLGDGKWRLLQAVEETGSLKGAMEKLNLSYRKTWDNLNKIEEKLGFNLITRVRGGIEGGSTTLTEEGKIIVKAFKQFHVLHDQLFKQSCEEVMKSFTN